MELAKTNRCWQWHWMPSSAFFVDLCWPLPSLCGGYPHLHTCHFAPLVPLVPPNPSRYNFGLHWCFECFLLSANVLSMQMWTSTVLGDSLQPPWAMEMEMALISEGLDSYQLWLSTALVSPEIGLILSLSCGDLRITQSLGIWEAFCLFHNLLGNKLARVTLVNGWATISQLLFAAISSFSTPTRWSSNCLSKWCIFDTMPPDL